MSLIPLFKVAMNPTVSQDITETLLSGNITQGPRVTEFEEKLSQKLRAPYLLSLNSATSGLSLALQLLNLDNTNDIVLASPLTCVATNWPILLQKLKLKWVDVDPQTCNIDLSDLKTKIDAKTKALIFVHWAGNPVDLDKIEEIKLYTKKTFGHDLQIIEDCAHSFGSMWKNGVCLGTSHNNIAVYSFQAIKHLTTVDGGAIVLPNKKLYDRAKLLRWFGISREQKVTTGDSRLEHDIVEVGTKYHMNDVTAAIGLSNLKIVSVNIEKHKVNAAFYERELQKIPEIELLYQVPGTSSASWIFTFKIIKGSKGKFLEYMKDNKVAVSQVHSRNDTHSCVTEFKTSLPGLDLLEKQIISIPVGWWLSQSDLEYIVCKIKQFFVPFHENIGKQKISE
jgi:dTDP-4-amino-4,6-dideoxygalactose transaminase